MLRHHFGRAFGILCSEPQAESRPSMHKAFPTVLSLSPVEVKFRPGLSLIHPLRPSWVPFRLPYLSSLPHPCMCFPQSSYTKSRKAWKRSISSTVWYGPWALGPSCGSGVASGLISVWCSLASGFFMRILLNGTIFWFFYWDLPNNAQGIHVPHFWFSANWVSQTLKYHELPSCPCSAQGLPKAVPLKIGNHVVPWLELGLVHPLSCPSFSLKFQGSVGM